MHTFYRPTRAKRSLAEGISSLLDRRLVGEQVEVVVGGSETPTATRAAPPAITKPRDSPKTEKQLVYGILSAARPTLGDMTPDTATLIRDGLALDVDQRAVVANALLESLHVADDTDYVDAAWGAEAARRLADVRAGAVELVDADEHYSRLRASLTE